MLGFDEARGTAGRDARLIDDYFDSIERLLDLVREQGRLLPPEGRGAAEGLADSVVALQEVGSQVCARGQRGLLLRLLEIHYWCLIPPQTSAQSNTLAKPLLL